MNARVEDVMTTRVVAVKKLEGRPETSSSGHEIVAGARHIEGVVSVRDRLVYPPTTAPVSSMGPLF